MSNENQTERKESVASAPPPARRAAIVRPSGRTRAATARSECCVSVSVVSMCVYVWMLNLRVSAMKVCKWRAMNIPCVPERFLPKRMMSSFCLGDNRPVLILPHRRAEFYDLCVGGTRV